MELKYTKNGKKVAVLGKLNSEQWIVQEIFVSNGQEFPAGENFIETTLLNEPAETWQAKQLKEDESRKKKIKADIERLEKEATIVRQKRDAAGLINYITDKYKNIEFAQLDTLLDFMSGRITHLVVEKYSDFEIVPLVDALSEVRTDYYSRRLEGLKLVTLFGCSENLERWGEPNKRLFRLDWRINQYRDGSGSSNTIYPRKSYEEAVSLVDKLIEDKDASDSLVELKAKYNLQNPSEEKIRALRLKQFEAKEKSIQSAAENLDKLKKELSEISLLAGGK